jgi:hypothetical protein
MGHGSGGDGLYGFMYKNPHGVATSQFSWIVLLEV